jgi:hypothetical protein
MRTVTLPSGNGVVQIVEAEQASNRQRKVALQRWQECIEADALRLSVLDADGNATAKPTAYEVHKLNILQALLCGLITSWTVKADGEPLELPSANPDVLEDLPAIDITALTEVVEHDIAILLPNFSKTAVLEEASGPKVEGGDTSESSE